MTTPSFDRDFWEQLWSRTLRERPDVVAGRPPNAHLTAEVRDLRPGRALDAGCGHGSDTFWLAAHGWHVTAVDFSAAALAHARSTAQAAGPDVAGRVDGSRRIWRPGPRSRVTTTLWAACTSMQRARLRRWSGGGGRSRGWRHPVSRRAPADRPGHRSRHPRGRPGAGLGRSGGRRARSPPLGICRRRGSSAGRGRHRRGRRDTCAPSGVTVPLVCGTSGTEQRLLRYQAK